jgi:hypothetical protein
LISRLALPLVVTAVQLGAAALALGRPDLAAARAFLGGGLPTGDEALGALGLLVWAIVLGGAAWSAGSLARELGSRAATSRRVRESSALATGLLILAVGAVHHLTYHVGLAGGSVQEAQSVLGR